MTKRNSIFLIFLAFFTLQSCSKIDDGIGNIKSTTSSKVTKADKNIELNKSTGLAQPTAEANKRQKANVRKSIGKKLDLGYNNPKSCDIKKANRLVGKEFKKIPSRSLPRNFRLIRPKTKIINDSLPGRVNLQLNNKGKVTKAYCG